MEHGAVNIAEFLFLLIAILVGAKVLGELAERIGQPAVLGELLAGVVLGTSVLGIVDPELPILRLLSEVGVIILLFQIGLDTDLGELLAVGPSSAVVAVVGVVLPFALGYGVMAWLGYGILPSVVAGAALTATSVGITARVLADLGRLDDAESRVVLGAAVIDDVVGLIILGVVARTVMGNTPTAGTVAQITLIAFGFIVAALVVGRLVVPPIFRYLAREGSREALATMALAMTFAFAYVADVAGSAVLIGAFVAGMVLEPTPQAKVVRREILGLGAFFVPIFFVAVGAAVDVRAFLDGTVLAAGGALIVVAIIGKFAAGYAPVWSGVKKSVIGAGMVPRGEVGLIFAQMGLTAGVLDAGLFSALTLMVMVTTFMAPPLLKWLFPARPGAKPEEPGGLAEMTTEA